MYVLHVAQDSSLNVIQPSQNVGQPCPNTMDAYTRKLCPQTVTLLVFCQYLFSDSLVEFE